MIPESIPEDAEEMFQCNKCNKGNIRLYEFNGKWQCDNCDWIEDEEFNETTMEDTGEEGAIKNRATIYGIQKGDSNRTGTKKGVV